MSIILSIIIPTYKRKESLSKLLEILISQSEKRLQIIVVDQNPKGYLDEIMSAFPAVEHVYQVNPNASLARNNGYQLSKGEYILFVDDDLLPTAQFCEEGVSIFEKYPLIAGFSPLVYNQEGKEIALQQAMQKKVDRFDGNHHFFRITDTISAALFFRKNYFEQTGGFDPYLFDFAKTAEDQEFFLRMRKNKLHFYFVPTVEIFHDENVAGGCELRTEDYWITRDKCIRSWAFRHRIHHNPAGKLSARGLWQLMRSSFINKQVILSGPTEILRNIELLRKAIHSSYLFFQTERQHYQKKIAEISHL